MTHIFTERYTKFWLGMTVLELYKQRSEYYSYTNMNIVFREESIPQMTFW